MPMAAQPKCPHGAVNCYAEAACAVPGRSPLAICVMEWICLFYDHPSLYSGSNTHSTPTVTAIMLIARPINMERHPTDRSRAALGARVVRGYGRAVARVRGLRGLGLGQSPCNY